MLSSVERQKCSSVGEGLFHEHVIVDLCQGFESYVLECDSIEKKKQKRLFEKRKRKKREVERKKKKSRYLCVVDSEL